VGRTAELAGTAEQMTACISSMLLDIETRMGNGQGKDRSPCEVPEKQKPLTQLIRSRDRDGKMEISLQVV